MDRDEHGASEEPTPDESDAILQRVLAEHGDDDADDDDEWNTRELESPRLVDDELSGWAVAKLPDGSYEMYPLDSPREPPELPIVEQPKPSVSTRRSYSVPEALPSTKGKFKTKKKTPGPGQYNIKRDFDLGSKYSFGYCPDRKRLSVSSSSWTPKLDMDTPAATYVEFRKPKGVSILLPIEIPKWGLPDEVPRSVPPGVGEDHPQEMNPPKWSLTFPPSPPLALESSPSQVPVIPLRTDKLGDKAPKFSVGLKPDNLRNSTSDWTVNQSSNILAPGYKFQHMDQRTSRGSKKQPGGAFPGRPIGNILALKTAAEDVPNMYLVHKYQSRTLKSEAIRGNAFTSAARFPDI